MRFTDWDELSDKLSKIDLIISCKLDRIIPLYIYNNVKYGAINIHPSLLPKYTGANPWFAMYCNYDLEGGVTIHRISSSPDSGNILIQKAFRISPGEPLPVATDKADNIASHLLKEVIDRRLFLKYGIPQTRHESPGKIDIASLKHFPANRLWHILRGFPTLISRLYPELPHPYFEAAEFTTLPASNNVGSIIKKKDGSFIIGCVNGYISLCDFSRIPMTDDYVEAVKSSSFVNKEMDEFVFEKDVNNNVSFIQGRQAIVFPAFYRNEKVAVRLPRNIDAVRLPSYSAKLTAVVDFINKNNLSHFVNFRIIDNAIDTPKGVYPAIIMNWHSGDSLMGYLKRNLRNSTALYDLLNKFRSICIRNHESGIVHGDIHSDNISVDDYGNITLLDIDNIWTPDIGQVADQGGNRNFQHPLRLCNRYMFSGIDFFSEIIVFSTIYIASHAPQIFEQFAADDCLFHESDYISPSQSPLMSALSQDKNLFHLVHLLRSTFQVSSLQDITPFDLFSS